MSSPVTSHGSQMAPLPRYDDYKRTHRLTPRHVNLGPRWSSKYSLYMLCNESHRGKLVNELARHLDSKVLLDAISEGDCSEAVHAGFLQAVVHDKVLRPQGDPGHVHDGILRDLRVQVPPELEGGGGALRRRLRGGVLRLLSTWWRFVEWHVIEALHVALDLTDHLQGRLPGDAGVHHGGVLAGDVEGGLGGAEGLVGPGMLVVIEGHVRESPRPCRLVIDFCEGIQGLSGTVQRFFQLQDGTVQLGHPEEGIPDVLLLPHHPGQVERILDISVSVVHGHHFQRAQAPQMRINGNDEEPEEVIRTRVFLRQLQGVAGGANGVVLHLVAEADARVVGQRPGLSYLAPELLGARAHGAHLLQGRPEVPLPPLAVRGPEPLRQVAVQLRHEAQRPRLALLVLRLHEQLVALLRHGQRVVQRARARVHARQAQHHVGRLAGISNVFKQRLLLL
mmetsp:Transcript_79231/g.232651  ORF Transcript_79231/g.232651 Transcript_79231/m.232651 type:complete len:449 (-) Transcript_79231:1367-2713(-)